MKHGPNITRLITYFCARLAIPSGGNFYDGIRFIQDANHRKHILEQAERETIAAVVLIKATSDNPFGEDEEAIAGYLLQRIAEKKSKQRNRGV